MPSGASSVPRRSRRADRSPKLTAMSPEQPQPQPPAPPPGQQPGSPPRPKSRFRLSLWWIVLAAILLAVNYTLSSRATGTPSRPRVPYSPFFLNQVKAGNVELITSKGTAIQGTLKEPKTYEDDKTASKFKTEIPAFADT